MPSISYAICAHNEHVELERLLFILNQNIRDIDEVVIQLDTTATEEVKEICYKYPAFSLWGYPLNGDFSAFKNHLKSKCSKEYIINLDADEYPSPQLLIHLPDILNDNPEIELFRVPRINTVSGLTQEHVQKWRWYVNEKGWVNYPDKQSRIFKNLPEIQWVNKVHEVIVGAKVVADLPSGYDLIHPKDIERQEKQNNFYNTL